MKVVIRFDPPFAGMAVWFYEDRQDGRYVVMPTELTVTKMKPAEETSPTFRFDERGGTEFLNSLVNALVEAGFKPDEIKAHDKEVGALKYHLEDMRDLVFKTTDNKK